MKIYEFAIQMEVDQGDYYRKMTELTDHETIQQIFRYLAQAEEKHIKIIQMLKKEEMFQLDLEDLSISQSLFKDLKAAPLPGLLPGDEARIYEKALNMEKESLDFFQHKAQDLMTENGKKAFKVLAAEEVRHAMFLENVIRYVYQPEWWVENAEYQKPGETLS